MSDELIPGQPVTVRRLVPRFTSLHGPILPVDVWIPAKFLGFQDGHPIIEWPDGRCEVIELRKDVRG